MAFDSQSSVLSSALSSIPGDVDGSSITNASVEIQSESNVELLALVPQRKRAKRQRSSLIWDHAIQQGSKLDVDQDGDPIWRCCYCKQTYKIKSGTKKATEHLRKAHLVTTESPYEKRQRSIQRDIRISMLKASEQSSPMLNHLDPVVLQDLYLRLIVIHGIPFNAVVWPELRTFLEYINPMANSLLPYSPSTISSLLTRTYLFEKDVIKQTLQSALSSIHLTLDLWSSPNHLSLLGIVAHYTDDNGQLTNAVLGMQEVDGEHTGENLALVVIEVLEEYQILSKVGYFMMDNATNNDTMIQYFSTLLDDHDIDYDPKLHRLRCNGHIINLVVRAFLFETHPDVTKLIEQATPDFDEPTNQDLECWRRFGPLGKLHNIVVFVRRSPQRLQAFKKLSGGRVLVRDNATRWNSWWSMLDCALELQSSISAFCSQHKELSSDQLTFDEWETVQHIKDLLEPFYIATKATEGADVTIDNVLLSMDFLLEHLELSKSTFKDDTFLLPCIETAWAKLDKYYNKTDRTPIYLAAIVLNPRWKWQYFENIWPTQWVEKAQISVECFWTTYYKSRDFQIPLVTATSTEASKSKFEAWLTKQAPLAPPLDEYQRYITSMVLPDCKKARDWWLEPPQRKLYPNLSIMAIDLLSIPAMSAEPERLFSGAKHTVSPLRQSLTAATINATECLKSWFKTSKGENNPASIGGSSGVAGADSDHDGEIL